MKGGRLQFHWILRIFCVPSRRPGPLCSRCDNDARARAKEQRETRAGTLGSKNQMRARVCR